MNRQQRRAQKRGAAQPATPGTVIVGFCYAQQTITPQWRRSLTLVVVRDQATSRRIVGELAQESSGVHIPDGRCKIVEAFLAHPAHPDWLWLVDTDATFADDTLERLIAVADPDTRPIVGALAFGVRPQKDEGGADLFNAVQASPLELFPTIYTANADATANCILDYPRDALVQCNSTGAHCLLIHRRVLEHPGWRDDSHPLPWFRTAVAAGRVVSEDQFFCLMAGNLGFPVHVDTRIKTGHVKTFVADEDMFLERRGFPDHDTVTAIVPVLCRPRNVRPLMASWAQHSPPGSRLLFVASAGDDSELDELVAAGADHIVCDDDSWARKVNHAFETIDTPWMLLCGDDIRFGFGWWDQTRAARNAGASVIGTNDGTANPQLASWSPHCLVRTSYARTCGTIDEVNKVVHDGYRHWFVDNELCATAQLRGMWTSCPGALIEHLHPLFGKADDDDIYRLGKKFFADDQALASRRQGLLNAS